MVTVDLLEQATFWREKMAAILRKLLRSKLRHEGRVATLAALADLLTDVQSLPPPCMDWELELGITLNIFILDFHNFTHRRIKALSSTLTRILVHLAPARRLPDQLSPLPRAFAIYECLITDAAVLSQLTGTSLRLLLTILSLLLLQSASNLAAAVSRTAVQLLNSLTASLHNRIKDEDLLSLTPQCENKTPLSVLSFLNPTADCSEAWTLDQLLLVPAAILDTGDAENLDQAQTYLKSLVDTGDSEQKSLALFLQAVAEKQRGRRSEFKQYLGRLLLRSKLHPEALTVQAYLLRGFYLLEEGLFQLALSSFGKVLLLSACQLTAILGTARCLAGLGKVRPELDTWNMLVKILQLQQEQATNHGQSDVKQGDPKGHHDPRSQEERRSQEDPMSQDENSPIAGDSLQDLGHPEGERSSSLDLIDVLAGLFGASPPTLLQATLTLARKLFLLGEWADAADKFLDCLVLLEEQEKRDSCLTSVSHLEVKLEAALALLNSQKTSSCLAVLDSIQPQMVACLKRKRNSSFGADFLQKFLYGEAHLSLEDFNRAGQYLKEALATDIADSLEERTEKKRMVVDGEAMKRKIEVNNDCLLDLEQLAGLRARVYYELSKVYSGLQELDSEGRALLTAIKLRPQPQYTAAYKTYLRNRGRPEEAAAVKTIEMSASETTTLENLNLCFQYLLDTGNKHFHPEIHQDE